jgi:hypothetical protein
MVPSLKLEKLTVTTKADHTLPYHQAIGKLLYLAISCWPNIYYMVPLCQWVVHQALASNQASPTLPQGHSQFGPLLQLTLHQPTQLFNSCTPTYLQHKPWPIQRRQSQVHVNHQSSPLQSHHHVDHQESEDHLPQDY